MTTARTIGFRYLVAAVLALALVLAGCSDSGGEAGIDVSLQGETTTTQEAAAGFLEGSVDGFISPFTGLASLFDGDVEVYDDETGSGYPIGFAVGLVLIVAILTSAIFGGRRYVIVERTREPIA